MGNRYGRNQKRRHRERIANLEGDLRSTLGKLEELRVSHWDLVARITERFPWSTLLPAIEATGLSLTTCLHISCWPGGVSIPICDISGSPHELRHKVLEVPLDVLEALFIEHQGSLDSEVHLKFKGDRGAVWAYRYAISEQALLSLPRHRTLTDEVLGHARIAIERAKCRPGVPA